MHIFSRALLPSGGGDRSIKQVSADDNRFFVVLKNGDLYGCGRNNVGQFGTGDTTNVLTLTKIAENVAYAYIDSDTGLYLTKNGDLYMSGINSKGKMGGGAISVYQGYPTYSYSNLNTTFTKRAENVAQVVCSGNTTWYITKDGDLFGSGWNDSGQQGSGDTNDVNAFTKRASKVKKVYASDHTTWYINNDNELWGCGRNWYYLQGDGTYNNVTTFTKRADNVKEFISIESNSCVSWYITNDGELWGCGNNEYANQGENSKDHVRYFTKRAENVELAVCNERVSWYITKDGDLFGCGWNQGGNQGNGVTGDSTTVVYGFTKRAEKVKQLIAEESNTLYVNLSNELYTIKNAYFTKTAENVKEIIDTKGVYRISAYISSSNELFATNCTDSNNAGIGISTALPYCKIAEKVSKPIFVRKAFIIYTDTNGNLYGCGAGNYGQQGNGSTDNVLTFENKMQYLR